MNARRYVAVLALLAAAGCGRKPELPRTIEVGGTVMLRGGKMLAAGMVRFESRNPTAFLTTGPIRPDGRFSLTTFGPHGLKVPGAVEGAYTVSILAPVGDDPVPRLLEVTRPSVVVKPDGRNWFQVTALPK